MKINCFQAPANDDSTYSGQAENSGAFTFDETGLSNGVTPAA